MSESKKGRLQGVWTVLSILYQTRELFGIFPRRLSYYKKMFNTLQKTWYIDNYSISFIFEKKGWKIIYLSGIFVHLLWPLWLFSTLPIHYFFILNLFPTNSRRFHKSFGINLFKRSCWYGPWHREGEKRNSLQTCSLNENIHKKIME